jgi:uncharacterized integral membrane protein
MPTLRLIAVLVLIGLIVIFAIQNADTTEIRFLFISVESSLAVLLFIVFAVGLALGWLLRTLGAWGSQEEPASDERASDDG